jgi:hypothetical protein
LESSFEFRIRIEIEDKRVTVTKNECLGGWVLRKEEKETWDAAEYMYMYTFSKAAGPCDCISSRERACVLWIFTSTAQPSS